MRKHITNTRLKKYQYNLNKYLDNIYESQKILPKLHVFEIVFRNKIDNFFKKEIHKDWLIQISQNTFPISIHTKSVNTINGIIKELKKQKKPITNDHILSNITLGFWTNFFNKASIANYRKYDKNQCHDFISQMTGIPLSDLSKSVAEENAYDELVLIRDFRNRVFHYERITHLKIHTEKLIDKYLSHFEQKDEIKKFLKKTEVRKSKPFITTRKRR